jgi:flagellar hook assembly protein FlgD
VIPRDYALMQNYPNPFNPSTTIPVAVPQESQILLEVYDVLGQCVSSIYTGVIGPGKHYFTWNGRNAQGRPLSSGTYFTRLSVRSGITRVGKMSLVR